MTELTEYNCIIERADEVGGTLLVELASVVGETFQYQAGQYLYLEVEPDDFRPFSIASSPRDDHLELHIRLLPDNATLNTVQELMVVGNNVRVRLAHGECTLSRRQAGRPLIFIAGGTGYAPFHAMLQELLADNLSDDVQVFWGAGTFDELYLHDELMAWSAQHHGLNYQPVVQFPEAGQEVMTGMVHEATLEKINNLADYDIFLGGSAVMVGAVYKALLANGAQSDNIYSDMLDLGMCKLDE